MTRSIFLGAASFALIVAVSLPASAQVPAAQNTSAGAGRVQEQITQPSLITNAPLSPVEVQQGPLVQAPAGAEKIKFVLGDINLEGVTAYSEDQLRPVYASQIGQTISLADLYDIAGRLTTKFRNDGYVLTQVVVPPQTIGKDGGPVTLRVVEGYIDTIAVRAEENAPAESTAALAQINKIASNIATGKALNIRDLERYLLLINDLPGVTARGVLSPSAGKVGAADLNILMIRDRFDARIGLDNYGTRFLGPWQFSASGGANSLLGMNERLTAQAVIAPQPGENIELGYAALGYTQPLLSNGLRFGLNVNHSETNPGYRLKQFNVRGHSTYAAADLFYPVIRSRATNLYTTMTFDIRDVRTSNNIELTRVDHIRALRGDVRLEHLDTLFGAGLNVLDFEVSRGLDVLNASNKAFANKSRADGDPEFTKITLELQRLQRLADQFNLLLSAHGQISDAPLLTAEQFGVGGMSYGRGYDPSEIIGDAGFATKVELQWNVPGAFSVTHDNQFFGFYDIGQVWTRNTPATTQTETANSVGFGVRSKILSGTNADFTVGIPLKRLVATEGDNDPRFFLSVGQKF